MRAMATVQKGEKLLLKIGGVIYGFATDCNLTIETETTEENVARFKLGVSAGQWKDYESVSNSWSMDSSHLYSVDGADFKTLFETQADGSPVTVYFVPTKNKASATNPGDKGTTGYMEEDDSVEGYGYTGSAIITSLSVGAPVDGQATFQINLQGTGELLSIGIVPEPEI